MKSLKIFSTIVILIIVLLFIIFIPKSSGKDPPIKTQPVYITGQAWEGVPFTMESLSLTEYVLEITVYNTGRKPFSFNQVICTYITATKKAFRHIINLGRVTVRPGKFETFRLSTGHLTLRIITTSDDKGVALFLHFLRSTDIVAGPFSTLLPPDPMEFPRESESRKGEPLLFYADIPLALD